ncbi:hypothetical protein [Campylobacter sp.]|uniref:hypothetical protein n=1 Tax=Campylobacter sp. TaxID=205 RepID=UPI0025BCCE80|nr:hypothetical protein [Campylobacter sp.]
MAGELGLRALGAGADALGFDNASKSLKDTADDLGQTFSQSAEAVGQTGGAGTTRIIGRGLKNFVTGQAAANQKLARGINNVLADTADFYGADRARDFFRENSNLASSAINKIENFGDNDMKGWQAAGEIADATALAPAMLGHSAKAARLAKALGASQKVATRIGNAVGSAANGAIMGGFTGGARAYGQPKPDLKQAGLESTIWGGANAILGGLSRAPILAKGVLGKASEQTQKAAQGLDYQNLREGVPTPAGTTAPQTRADGELLSPPLSSDQSARLNRYSDTSRTMAAADNAGSVTDKTIMPQNFEAAAEASNSQHKQQVLGAQMNTGKEHFSPTDNTIIPQSSVAEGILNNPNLFGLDENVIKAIRSELEEAAGIAPKKMNEAAKGADKAETAAAQAPNPFLDEILRVTNPANNNAYLDQILAITNPKAIQKEKRGIYNVAYNGKNSTSVYPDIDFVENAVKLEQGSKKRGGAAHIQKHFEKDAKGYVTPAEMTQIGDRMREYTAKFKKPYIDAGGGRLYEWQDKDGVKFRVVVYDGGVGSTTHITTTPVNERIISFYSDRNLKKPMEFKTPALREADEAIRGGDTLSSLSTPQAMRNQGLDTATDIIPQNGENMIKGFSSSAIPANIASAGAGAATGAALDDKNRARGAFIGALGGLGLVNAPSLVSKLKGGAKVGEIAQDIEAAAKDKPSILSNMRSYLKAVGANSASELKDLSGKDIGLSYARQMASEHINKEFKNIAYEILSGSQSLAQNLKNGAINAARFARRTLSETKGADYLLRNDELFSAKSAYSAKMENLQSALSGLDDADRVAMHEYMVGEGNAIKPELKPLADALRRQIDDMSAKLVDLGVLDKASRDALAGQYLARSYEKHLKDRINSVFSSGKKVDEIHSRGFAFKEFKDREAMDKFLSKNPQIAKSMDQAYNKGGVRVVEKPNGKIELWRDYTKDERSAMGEIKKISFLSHLPHIVASQTARTPLLFGL